MPQSLAQRRYAGGFGGWIGWVAACLISYRSSPSWNAWGIGFESLTEKIETNSAAGKLIFHLFAALAEFERNLIRERTHAGLAAARARGRSGGRRPKLGEKQLREIRALLRDPEIKVADVARRYGVSRTTFYKLGVIKPQGKDYQNETGTPV
ncbi:hypothetical protein R52603_01951 [Paraburkholderia saeva]|nr:hypothetical protein R52603_01951 [Paraburkholderia saeva]